MDASPHLIMYVEGLRISKTYRDYEALRYTSKGLRYTFC
jgi:uncharacterized protein YlbG (UPF0298 family)